MESIYRRKAVWWPSPNYGPRKKPVKRVILHQTGATKESSLVWLQAKESNVSAHYLIGKNGATFQLVKEFHVAWHCRFANADSIGIELEHLDGDPPIPAPQYRALQALLLDICERYKLRPENVQGHRWATPFARTKCPGTILSASGSREDFDRAVRILLLDLNKTG